MKFLKEAALLDYALAKTMKIRPNQHTDLLRLLFTGDSLKIKKTLKLVSKPHFSYNFLIQNFIL